MKLRWYTWVGSGVLTLLVLIGGTLAWVINTSSGARWALTRVSGLLNDALQVARVDGTLAGPLTLTGLAYRDPKSGIDVEAQYVSVDIDLHELLGMTVHVAAAELRDIEVRLSEPAQPPPPPRPDDQPFTLDAPIDVVVDRFLLARARVINDAQPVVTLDSAAFAGRWIGSALSVRQLDVQSPQGEIHVQGDVRQRRAARGSCEWGGAQGCARAPYYEGKGGGRFRWQVGTRTFAGSLAATGRDATSHVSLQLSAPIDARLTVQLRHLDNLPWQFTLDAPRFDPREELLPDSSLQSLAARLEGSGSLREGTIAGVLEINDEAIRIERARFVRGSAALDLDSVVRFGGGTVAAKGTVRTRQEPLAADLNLSWSDLVIPATLAGQELSTRGQLDFNGSAEAYRAAGKLSVGPAQRIANLELKLQGTPQRVQIEQLDIVQQAGRFAANGTLDLQPQLAWTLRARARRFDPGAFAVQWPGNLNFDLETHGTIPESGPQGTLVVDNLRGQLRNRDLGGRVDLSMTPGRVIAGDLDLTSGQSRIQLVGRRGDTMDAVATLAVPAVNDWLPSGAGEINGRITANGRWPDLNVSGRVNGSALQIATLRADRLALQWSIDRPTTTPSGSVSLEATKLIASGFEFATVRAQVDGDVKRHTVDVEATGTPLATAFFIEGSLDGAAWSGTIRRLMLDVKDAARLTLQQPVKLAYSPELVRMSQACFADRDIRLCLQGDRASTGVMHASYSLQNVPLGLANAFASASMPLEFAGTLDGTGGIESSADGVFSGRAEIRSASGSISRQLEVADAAPEVLLTYADLGLDAQLEGANARARLSARLNDTGSLNGAVALRGLAAPVTNIDGQLSASLPSLRVVEVFAPQLANVQGRADVRATIGGTLDDPQLGGEFRIADLAADIPEVGLKLRNGSIGVTPQASDRFRIVGGISSGPGRVEFEGEATSAGLVDMRLSGKQFQAADIPSANVVIDPNLQFQRDSQLMRLTGSLHVPAAKVDLQKLPRTENTQGVSSDVVVIDAHTQQEEQVEATPLTADIEVTLGDKVQLVGFGLDARVLGQLDIKERPGAATSGSGEVRVEGTYKAYGQDLAIRQGQLLFAGTPLDNPRLNIVAVREIEDITAGLRVTGSAKNPQLSVFSDPAMGQSDALAYLVTGKPLNEVGQGNAEEGDMLQSAARSLGTAAGGLLAKNIGRRLGVDEIGIKDDELIGGAALTVGQYLSPRLYLSYGVGLFEPGEVITLRYKLSRSLALEVLNGSEDSRAGLEFRKER